MLRREGSAVALARASAFIRSPVCSLPQAAAPRPRLRRRAVNADNENQTAGVPNNAFVVRTPSSARSARRYRKQRYNINRHTMRQCGEKVTS